MTDKERAEAALAEWAHVHRDRDRRIREAVAAGVSKHRVHQLTGISRVTIDKLLTQQDA